MNKPSFISTFTVGLGIVLGSIDMIWIGFILMAIGAAGYLYKTWEEKSSRSLGWEIIFIKVAPYLIIGLLIFAGYNFIMAILSI